MNDGETPEKEPPIVARPNPSTMTTNSSDATGNTQAEIRKELGEFERISIKIQRRMLGVTALVAFITGAYVVITYLQLNEMRSGSGDTTKLREAAEKQAAQLKTLAEQTATLVEQNKSLARSASKSATAAEKSQTATEQLARATADAAAASHSLAESAGQSTAATQRLASAANNANAVSRELVKTTQQAIDTNKGISRAFVFAKGVELQEIYMSSVLGPALGRDGDTRNRFIRVQLENTGATPTQDLTVTSSCWETYGRKLLDRAADASGFDVCAVDPKDPSFKRNATLSMVLAPKQIRPFGGCNVGATGLVLNEIGALPLYYTFGTVHYRDIFNPSYIHRTEYCFVITLTGSEYRAGTSVRDQKMPPLGIFATPCQNHNCSDEECNGQSPLP